MKLISALVFLAISLPAFAANIFPGSTLEILEDAKAVSLKDRMLASPLLNYAIFSEGKSLNALPVMEQNTEFCLVEKDSQTSSLKGVYTFNGYGFTQYGTKLKSLAISCYQTKFNSYNSKYIASPAELTPLIITSALGGYANFTFALPESLFIGNVIFNTGVRTGKEVYGNARCSLITFKVGSSVKMLFSNDRASCTMTVEKWAKVPTANRGEVLKLSGPGNFIGVNTTCSLEFEVNNGKLTGRALQNIQHNNSGSYCQF